ncbi:MAG TPA: efflux RND transporter periplasmic adaptor subunit [bacterium]|mgnify:CR=1 FL=1|nr:efflux RND transporter periplasmic adaptor subunit [bacterium]
MQKKSRKKLFIFLGVLVIIAVLVVANLVKKGDKIKIQTEKVLRGTLTETVSGAAKIQPEVQVKISAKVSGQIVSLGVREGDDVKKGQFLVQLDQEGYRAALEQAESSLAYARAGFIKSESEYRRVRKLHEDNLASAAELELARSVYEQAQATVAQADASLRQAADNLDKTTIYAPMDGTVSLLNKKLGEMAMGSQFTLDVIMIVADLTRMQAETDIDENDVIRVTVGDTANIMVDAFPDRSFRGVVTEIANTGTTTGMGTQEQVTNFLVKAAMIEKPERLRPGMSSTVDIITESLTDVLKVPIQCVTLRKPLEEEQGESETPEESGTPADSPERDVRSSEKKPVNVVFRVDNGIVRQIPVQTGISSDTEWEIKNGLEEGWDVVSGPYRILSQILKDGDAVTVDNSQSKKLQR